MKCLFLSRHPLRPCVKRWVETLVNDTVEFFEISLSYPPDLDEFIRIYDSFDRTYDIIIGVFPAEYALKLHEKCYTFFWLKNTPSLREKNQFLCTGIWKSSRTGLCFFPIIDSDEPNEIQGVK